ncbi:MAG TPA: sulfite exporter TauE/SafE family protein [Chryseolinea sp.]|nr:sulfite exporter TauE/SafE family protein [Chryseolinea sp.]
MEIIGYILSIFIGIVLGLLGGGGSILSIPILVYLFKVDVVLASAYTLFIVGVTSFIGAVPKYKEHLVSIKAGLLFGVPSILSIFATRKWVIPAIPEIVFQTESFVFTKRLLLLGILAILMILAAIFMITGRKEIENNEHTSRIPLVMFEGILIGFLTGLVGAGGGFLIIPALMLLTGLPFKTAVGTSLFVIAINSLSGFLGDVFNYKIDWPFLLSITTLATFGIFIGNQLTHKITGKTLRKSFGWLVLCVGLGIFFRELTIGHTN